MDQAECLQACERPSGLSRGDVRYSGAYWRNLRKFLKLHGRDETTEFGYTYRFDKWYWEPDGLSVSCAECTCDYCALRLSGPANANHVLRIDLAAFSDLVGEPMVAQYAPEEDDPRNPCHFLIIPDEADVEVLETFLSDLRERFKNGEKRPSNVEERDVATKMQKELGLVFELRRDVRERGPAE